ncbi:MAG: multicopper oxidase domain-containing protein [Cytophagales bacterium]|nr:multicopper oxidase domain-containing protein [Cytophagales bacterium]
MKFTRLTYGSVFFCLTLLFIRCAKEPAPDDGTTFAPKFTSYAISDFTVADPTIVMPTGSSNFEKIEWAKKPASIYDESLHGHKINADSTFELVIETTKPGRVQVAFFNDISSADVTLDVRVSDKSGAVVDTMQLTIDDKYGPFKTGYVQLNVAYSCKLYFKARSTFYLKEIRKIPQNVVAKGNHLQTTIYSQFARTDQVTGAKSDSIWTRAYGLAEGIDMISGPILRFSPGDLVEVGIINKLDKETSPVLQQFEKLHGDRLLEDEELAEAPLHGEINVPHNLDNTNLHVHGLHVDPSKDDVTIVIVPEGDTTTYDAPDTDAPVTSAEDLNKYSVADQGIKRGKWNYQYKIPEDHLPGTHWFHPHKHGATAAQVENGMAGTIIIEENNTNSLVPYPENPADIPAYETWKLNHERVFSIQEISNYGFNLGEGNRKGDTTIVGKTTLDLTVNGESNPNISFEAGQLERWRLVNAGTNHRAFAHIWLGRYDSLDNSWISTPIHLVAVDGITLAEPIEITAEQPALLAPGNRSDFLVQLPKPGTYVLFKNYNIKNLYIKDKHGIPIFNSETPDKPRFWPYIASNKHNPYLFAPNTDTSTINYLGYLHRWKGAKNKAWDYQFNVVPNMKAEVVDDYFLDITFPTVPSDIVGTAGDWKPAAFGVAVPAGRLVTAEVTEVKTPRYVPKMPTRATLKGIAPTNWDKPPSYVSNIDRKKDVLQSRPVVFDVSGLGIGIQKVTNEHTAKAHSNQFTLNGRFFELNDPIGNPVAPGLVAKSYSSPRELLDNEHGIHDSQSLADSGYSFTFNKTAGTLYPSENYMPGGLTTEKNWYFVNPSYYKTIEFNGSTGEFSFSDVVNPSSPTWEKVTGLKDDATAIVNQKASNKNYQVLDLKKVDPGLPRAQSAEEWLLINNSDVSHPFHIHINPFFVVEVGQLAYMSKDNGKKFDWYMKSVMAEGEETKRKSWADAKPGDIFQSSMQVPGIVGNWWDTIVIPAHGFVRVRYWFNVPEQQGDTYPNITVNDNQDRVGIWVYHCHILRHEDRGMMMPVITKKLKE